MSRDLLRLHIPHSTQEERDCFKAVCYIWVENNDKLEEGDLLDLELNDGTVERWYIWYIKKNPNDNQIPPAAYGHFKSYKSIKVLGKTDDPQMMQKIMMNNLFFG